MRTIFTALFLWATAAMADPGVILFRAGDALTWTAIDSTSVIGRVSGGEAPPAGYHASMIGLWTTNDATYWWEQVATNKATLDAGATSSNGYLHFSGAADSKATADYSTYTNLGQNWTICGWIRLHPSAANNFFAGTYNYASSIAVGYGVGVTCDPSGAGVGIKTGAVSIISGSDVGNNVIWCSTNGTVSYSAWHFFAIVCTNGQSANWGFHGYLDGNIQALESWTGEPRQSYLTHGTNAFMIGGVAGYGIRSYVDIGNNSLRVFTSALTESELDTEYSRTDHP